MEESFRVDMFPTIAADLLKTCSVFIYSRTEIYSVRMYSEVAEVTMVLIKLRILIPILYQGSGLLKIAFNSNSKNVFSLFCLFLLIYFSLTYSLIVLLFFTNTLIYFCVVSGKAANWWRRAVKPRTGYERLVGGN